jgi:hypothetical protein
MKITIKHFSSAVELQFEHKHEQGRRELLSLPLNQRFYMAARQVWIIQNTAIKAGLLQRLESIGLELVEENTQPAQVSQQPSTEIATDSSTPQSFGMSPHERKADMKTRPRRTPSP